MQGRPSNTLALVVRDFTREIHWTVAELAERLRLNQQTLRNWIFSTASEGIP